MKPRVFFHYFLRRFFGDLVLTRAAALAFTTLLSLVPSSIFIFYILSFFPPLKEAAYQLQHFLVGNFVASAAPSVTAQLSAFLDHIRVLSWVNIAALSVFSLFLVYGIIDAVNGVWHIKMSRVSVMLSVLYTIVLTIAPIVSSFLIFFGSHLKSSPLFARMGAFGWSPYLFGCFVEFIIFTLFHWMIPSCRVYWRYAVLVGLMTTVLFELAKWGFVLYIYHFPTYAVIYGALSAIPLFFLWIFLTWVIIISNALICQILQEKDIVRHPEF